MRHQGEHLKVLKLSLSSGRLSNFQDYLTILNDSITGQNRKYYKQFRSNTQRSHIKEFF